LRQFQFLLQLRFQGSHLAFVGFVVVSGEVDHTVKDEDFEFCGERMSEGLRLFASDLRGDGNVTGKPFFR
jgi:hypothetical protein